MVFFQNYKRMIYQALFEGYVRGRQVRDGLTLMSLAEARYCLAIFSGLILKNLFSVKNLRVQLFLPWVLKIRLHPLFPSKKNSKCIILSFYQNWCEKARSKLCYPRPNMCQTHDKKARSFIFPGTQVLASPF